MRVLGKYNSALYKASLFGLFLGLTACEEPTTFVPTKTDSFVYYDADQYDQAQALLQADYLFVADYSYSMRPRVDEVLNSLDLFSDYLEEQNIDYKIGFVRGTTSSAGETLRYIPNSLVGPAITPSAVNLDALISLQLEGFSSVNGDNRRYMLEAADRTVHNGSLGFLRDASQLVYVFISDNDDISVGESGLGNRSLQSYVSSLRVKSDASYINARAWVLGESEGCPDDPTPNSFGDGPGTRLAQAARALNTGSSEAVRCLIDSEGAAGSLRDLARNVTRTTKRFKLRATPVTGTLEVFVDGVQRNEWSFLSASNEILFADGQEPEPGSQLSIYYSPLMKLSSGAKKDSIVVKVDGTQISEGEGNGWSYSDSSRQLTFNGSARPEDGAKVVVTYQVK